MATILLLEVGSGLDEQRGQEHLDDLDGQVVDHVLEADHARLDALLRRVVQAVDQRLAQLVKQLRLEDIVLVLLEDVRYPAQPQRHLRPHLLRVVVVVLQQRLHECRVDRLDLRVLYQSPALDELVYHDYRPQSVVLVLLLRERNDELVNFLDVLQSATLAVDHRDLLDPVDCFVLVKQLLQDMLRNRVDQNLVVRKVQQVLKCPDAAL